MAIKIKGVQKVLKNLTKEVQKINGRTKEGLRIAALFVEGESNKNTPHDKGVLIGSSFSSVSDTRVGPVARVGYTAKYAPFVHEMPSTNNFSKPDTGPKFLINAVTRNIQTILRIIQKRAKV